MTFSEALPTVVAELGDDLTAAGGLWVRSAWCREAGSTWRLRLLEIIDGPLPVGDLDGEWEYAGVSLRAQELPGERVGSWLREGKVTSDDGWESALSQPTDPLNWERRESYAQSGYEVFAWPSYEVQLGRLQANEPQRPLLSDSGAPSFASFYNAVAAFFGLGPSQLGGAAPSFAVFRRVDTRARINRVEISEDELLVEVEGTALDGLTVELAGDAPGTAETLKSSEAIVTVTFPLPKGLPPGAWVVVRAGSEWFDRRFLAWPWARGQEVGVTVEVPAKTKIEAFLAARESDTVEFKQEIPEAETTKAKVMKTVCAFANGSGGSLLFGITDDYEVIGLPAAKASKHQDTLSDLVDAWVEPTPTFSFEVLPVEGTERVVIELIVNTGQALFGSSKPNEPRRVYVRHHSRSVPARVREIEGIAQSRSAAGNFHYPRM
ncbi:hypothetical protein GCM10028798_27780 [Humibacter antri]